MSTDGMAIRAKAWIFTHHGRDNHFLRAIVVAFSIILSLESHRRHHKTFLWDS